MVILNGIVKSILAGPHEDALPEEIRIMIENISNSFGEIEGTSKVVTVVAISD